jgi:hypothetical protein
MRSRSAIALAGTTMLITKCSVRITNCVAANPAEPLASYQTIDNSLRGSLLHW